MAPELVTTIVCTNCGAELPPAASVCPGCGVATTVAAGQKPLPMASSAAVPHAVEDGTIRTSPKRKQGAGLPPSLARRACVSGNRVRYSGASLLDRPWFILGLLFFVTAILGLPLLWISRGFSLAWKTVLSLVVTLYTALLLWGFWWIMNWSVSRIMDSLR